MNATPLLQLQSAQVSIQNVEVLRGFSLRIEAGQMVGLIGRNGAGKTTMMRTLMGHLPMLGGQLLLDGADLRTLSAHERAALGIGYMPEITDIEAGGVLCPGRC